MIRAGGFKQAQAVCSTLLYSCGECLRCPQTALRMYGMFKEPKYLYWSVMSAVLQAQNPAADAAHNASLLLNLALRLLTTSPLPSHISPDHFYLHLVILKSLNRIQEGFELVTNPNGTQLCATSLVLDELRRDIFMAHGAFQEEIKICREKIQAG